MKSIIFGLCIWSMILISCGSITIRGPVTFEYSHLPTQNVAPSKYREVYIDANFGGEDKIYIDDAISRWNYALNGFLVLQLKSTQFDIPADKAQNITANGGLIIIRVSTLTCPFIPTYDDSKSHIIAWAELSTRDKVYLIRDRLDEQAIFPVMLHEIGHILGASHTSDPGLMYPIYTPRMYECIDRGTMEQISEFNDFPIDKLNYCNNFE